jgi:dihydrofolate reductase
MSLDGYIARAGGGHDWIPTDVDIDWDAFMARFDTVLMGRRSFEVMQRQGSVGMAGMRTYVFSRTLDPATLPSVTVIAEDAAEAIAALKREEGKEIWLFGGGILFGSLLEAGVVDVVEVAIVPVLLGQGIPLLPSLSHLQHLTLSGIRQYDGGLVLLTYDVEVP